MDNNNNHEQQNQQQYQQQYQQPNQQYQQNQQQYQQPYQQQPVQDGKSVGMAILSFFFPVIGLILFLVWKDQKPLKAKSAGIGAIVGVAVSVVGYIIMIVVGTFTRGMMY